jgi:hypothetical protein
MRSGNHGLTVKVHLWPLVEYGDAFDSEAARLWIKGTVEDADGGARKFNDAGELISILGKWNAAKLRRLRKPGKRAT